MFKVTKTVAAGVRDEKVNIFLDIVNTANHDCKVHLCIIVAKYSFFEEINQMPARAWL